MSKAAGLNVTAGVYWLLWRANTTAVPSMTLYPVPYMSSFNLAFPYYVFTVTGYGTSNAAIPADLSAVSLSGAADKAPYVALQIA